MLKFALLFYRRRKINSGYQLNKSRISFADSMHGVHGKSGQIHIKFN